MRSLSHVYSGAASLGAAGGGFFSEQQRFIADYVPIAAIALANKKLRGKIGVPRLTLPSFPNNKGSLQITFLSRLLLWRKPTFVQEDLSGYPMHFMPMARWWDLPNSHTSQKAWVTTGFFTSLLTVTTRGEDMGKKRSASYFSSSGIIIHSARRFNSPSIQKMIMHGTSTPVLDFGQQEQFSATNQSTG